MRVPAPSSPSSALQLSAQKYEEGERALQDACRIESEHQARLQVMQQHLEQLKQQEQHLQQVTSPHPPFLAWGYHAKDLNLCQ